MNYKNLKKKKFKEYCDNLIPNSKDNLFPKFSEVCNLNLVFKLYKSEVKNKDLKKMDFKQIIENMVIEQYFSNKKIEKTLDKRDQILLKKESKVHLHKLIKKGKKIYRKI